MPPLRIGVLGNETSWYTQTLVKAITSAGHTALVLDFELLRSRITAAGVNLLCGDVDLSSLHTLIVRMMPPGSLEEVVVRMDILRLLEAQGVPVVNPALAVECAVDKLLTTARLADAGLPVPDTISCESTSDAMEAFEQLGGDIVVKPLFGSEGRGMLRLSDADLAFRSFRTLERIDSVMYLQRFIAADSRDLRLLLLDGNVIGSMTRQNCQGDFRANVAQSGSASRAEPSDADIELAKRSMTATGCVFGGVDLIHDEQQNPYVLEVNAVPGWRALERVCDLDVAGELIAWISHRNNS